VSHFEKVTQIKTDYPVVTAIGGQNGVKGRIHQHYRLQKPEICPAYPQQADAVVKYIKKAGNISAGGTKTRTKNIKHSVVSYKRATEMIAKAEDTNNEHPLRSERPGIKPHC
jgi:hypothetical protein